MRKLTVLLDGLRFAEGPRWHDGRLWFSDMHSRRVMAVDLDGRAETILQLETSPSGLGWLPDGRLLIVSMEDHRVLRLDRDGPVVLADCSALAAFRSNDMVVDSQGRAYVGNFGFDIFTEPVRPRPTSLALVHPDGRVARAAADLMFPNGTVITPDGRTLIVGESYAARLTAFDIGAGGSLGNRRVWARLGRTDDPLSERPLPPVPDGIGLDAEGAIWVASPTTREVLRVVEGGAITERIPVSTNAYACMLGGPTGRTLFVCTAAEHDPAKSDSPRTGRIERCEVAVPHAGIP
jgi:sugar lactone lactonase YvrE